MANTAGRQVKLQTDQKQSLKSLQMLSVIEGLLLVCSMPSINVYLKKTAEGGTGPHAFLKNSSSLGHPLSLSGSSDEAGGIKTELMQA